MNHPQEGNAKLLASALLNLAAAALSAVGTAIAFGKYGAAMFALYTVDSNLLAMLACTAYAVFLIRRLVCGREVPVWSVMAKYTAVCCLSVTFLVVVAVLAPGGGRDGYRQMLLSGDMLYHHLFCPVLAVLSFFLFDRVPCRAGKAARCALLPTVLYAVVLVVLNLTRTVTGPYPFLRVYAQPLWASALWIVGILGGAWLLAWLLARLRRR